MKAPLRARNDSDAAQTDTIRTVAQKRVLADNRPEAVAQRKLAEMMNNSPRVLQQRVLSDAIHNSPRMVAQRHEINALFGGAPKPKEGGATLAAASPAQREEKTNNTGLPNRLKSGIESLSGMSMDHVKVHYNSYKPAQLQAHAYAQGNEIHLAAGQERHLPHEAWHIVQQAQGRVRPTLQMKAGAVNDDPALEKEADMMGERAVQFEGRYVARNLVAEESLTGAVKQRVAGFLQPADIVQLRKISLPDGDVVETENHTEEELHHLISGRFRMPGSFDALQALDEAIENGEYRGAMNHLKTLGVNQDLNRWSKDHPELSSAHHKLGKGQLGALFLRMKPSGQERLLNTLGLETPAGPAALARLPSNLISPRIGSQLASSDQRTDDPMNNQENSRSGEEFLDLVHDTAGSLTPRSHAYRRIAHQVARNAQARQETPAVTADGAADRLTEEEENIMSDSIVSAEIWHHKIESDPSKPSHHEDDNWSIDDDGKYTKKPVTPIPGELTEQDRENWRQARDNRIQTRKIEKFKEYWSMQRPLSFIAWKEWRGYSPNDFSLDDVMRGEYSEYIVPMMNWYRTRLRAAAQQQGIDPQHIAALID